MTVAIHQALLVCDPFGALPVVHLAGSEALNQLARFELVVDAEHADVDLAALLGVPARITLADGAGQQRTLPLIVVDAAYCGATRRGQRYELTLASPLHSLSLRSGRRIFLDKAADAIIQQILTDVGFDAGAVRWRLAEPLWARAQCVQYDETEWDFIVRLCADEGINVWIESDDDGAPVLIFGDHPSAHDESGTFPYQDAAGMAQSAGSLFALERTLRLGHEAVHVADDDDERPDVLIEGRAGDSAFEWYEYPSAVPAEGAERRAEVRLEQLRRLCDSAQASTHSVRFVVGRTIDVEGSGEHDGRYLVVALEHRLTQAVAEGEPQHYVARATLTPHHEERPFRPAPPSEVPRIDGFETALVTGAPGEEIHVDPLGCVKLRFHWDRAGIADDRSSRWCRTMQLAMNGSMMLPRVGFEAGVVFRDGRADVPLVLGKHYNATAAVPYPLPDRKATASLMSGSSPGGGSVNEIRLSDDAGKQQFAVQASNDQGVNTGGDVTTLVGVNEKYNVKGNLITSVKGAQTITVAANQTVAVGSGCFTKVKGGRNVDVGGVEAIEVTMNRSVDCGGAYDEAVGGLYFLRCNNNNDTLKASHLQAVGNMVISAAAGVNEQTVGTRDEHCAGARSVEAGQFETKAYGVMRITCGASSFTSSSVINTTVKSSATINAGAVSITGGGGVVLGKGSSVTIKAASLTCGGYAAAGSHTLGGWLVVTENSTTKHAETKAKG